jgi:phospholipid/cholesterol/gamma-HCH transport system substrate-binding protein
MSRSNSSKEWLQLKVGAFVIGGIVLTIVAIFMLSSRSSFFRNQYRLHCYFDDISGLTAGSQVKLAGVNVGFVESIQFESGADVVNAAEEEDSDDASDEGDEEEVRDPVIDSGGNTVKETGVKVRVNLKIDRKYQERIRSDSVASITTQGLLGDGIIFISVGSPDEPKLKDGDRVPKIRNPVGFSQLQRKGEKLIKTAGGLLENADDLVTNLNSILREVKTGKGLAHSVIYDPEAGQILTKAGRTMDNLNETTRHFASISGKIDQGQGTVGKFVNDPGVYNDLKTLLGKANRNKLVRSVIRYTMATREESQNK